LSVILQARPSGKPAAVGAAAVSPEYLRDTAIASDRGCRRHRRTCPLRFIEHLSLTGFLPDFLAWGSAGVDRVFVISGFVMVYSSEKLFGEGGASFVFLARRVARIVPLYWLNERGLLA